MGRKGNWFNALKKALDCSETSNQELGNSKKKWFKKKKKKSDPNSTSSETVPALATTTGLPNQPVLPQVIAPIEPTKLRSDAENEQTKHAYTVAVATAKAAEAAVAAAQAAAEVVRLTTSANHFAGKSKEELAAIKIQTAFRGLMARRKLRALRGLMRLKMVMQGQAVKRQTMNTLKSMQTLARVQSQIHERRLRMTEEKQNIQRQIQQKRAKEQVKELEKSQVKNGDGWDSSVKTKEQIEAKLHSKHEAAIRRERTMAYALTHQQQWKSSSTSLFMDPNMPHWGWSWLERWLAAKPWENATIPDKEFSTDNSSHVKAPKIAPSSATDSTKSYTRRNNAEKSSPKSVPKQPCSPAAARLSTSSTPSKKVSSNAAARKPRSPSPKTSKATSTWGIDDDAKSTPSEQSGRNSVAESPVRDDESLACSQTVPSYMATTESTKAKSRLGNESKGNNSRSVTPDRLSVSSAKKRASCPPSPARSRRSTASVADADTVTEHT